jgi:predicted dehydrogenase
MVSSLIKGCKRVAFDSTALIVGSGSIARRHIANLRKLCPTCRIVVLRRDTTKCLELVDADRVVSKLEDAISESPDIAIVANPAPFHIPIAQCLADVGCHLLIEKPLSDGKKGISKLIETCTARKTILMIGYNLRYCPSLQTMAKLVTNGKIGRIQYLSAQVGQYLPDWRPATDYRCGVTAQAALGGGALLELSHEIDIALWLGGSVLSVSANLARVSSLEINTEDCVDILINYSSGACGHIHMDLLQRTPTRRCRVVGSEGTLLWDYYEDSLLFSDSNGQWERIEAPQMGDRNNMYLNELADFLFCIKQKIIPLVNEKVGRDVLAVALAARESSEKRKTIMVSSC